MTLINALAFRLPSNRIWTYQNSVLFTSSLYSEAIRLDLLLPYFIKRVFERAHFKKYMCVFSHLLIHRFIDLSLKVTVFFYSKFYRGLVRFLYKHVYRIYLKRKRRQRNRRRVLSLIYTFHKSMGALNRNLALLMSIYRSILLVTIRSYHYKSNINIHFKLLNQRAFSASYIVNYFAYKLNSGTDLNRTLKSTFNMFERGFMTGIRGLKVVCAGRFTRKQRAHHSIRQAGIIETSTLGAKVDYALMTARLKYGASSIRIWVNFI